jgi:hypothetical protein
MGASVSLPASISSANISAVRGGGGHDVQVAGVLGQVVAQAFDLEEDGDALAVEHRAVDQAVAGHVFLHLGQHLVDGGGDGGLVGLVLGQAVHGVAHHQRGSAGLMTMMALPFLAPPTFSTAPRWCA